MGFLATGWSGACIFRNVSVPRAPLTSLSMVCPHRHNLSLPMSILMGIPHMTQVWVVHASPVSTGTMPCRARQWHRRACRRAGAQNRQRLIVDPRCPRKRLFQAIAGSAMCVTPVLLMDFAIAWKQESAMHVLLCKTRVRWRFRAASYTTTTNNQASQNERES